MPEVMTAKQLADYLQVNELTIYKRVRLGIIPVVKMGRALRFKKDIIDKWLEIESGWDEEFETLLRKTQVFGKEAGITEQKIQRTVEEIRAADRR
ncbi:MAG: helix-turn-helix domain-containing protein [Candidatus Omnitrophota bacterium]|nr:helix-turn-helix domain-containing protein [Candidatus Omnitrophota bacterium]